MAAAGQRAHASSAAAGGPGWALPVAVALAVAGLQLWLVARAGTDVPFYDQWGVEGRWLYPAWLDGSLRFFDLLRPHNEHHIFWTNLLNLGLFSVDGQWDPLLQLAAIVGLRAVCAAGLAAGLMAGGGRAVRLLVAAGAVGAFLPHLAWHGVLWGFESQVYFALGFSLLAFGLLGGGRRSEGRWLAGLAAGVAAQLAMATGAFVPVALLGVAVVRLAERRPRPGEARRVIAAVLLLGLAWALRVTVPGHAGLVPASARQFLAVLGRCLAWPYPDNPWVALVANLPLWLLVGLRLARRHAPRPGEDFALLLGFFATAAGIAEAALRGGGPELAGGVPSRYADLQVLLPVANAWCLAALVPDASARWRRVAWTAGLAWAGVLAAGWLALSAEMWRGVIRPRIADRDAPVRLMQAFQVSGNAQMFAGQPRLYVPSPDLSEVAQVLADPRLRGHLPPSLQPGRPEGPLSRWVRRARRHADLLLGLALAAAAALAVFGSRRRGFTPGASSGKT
ncbi:MAG TPA: hypothetical protein VMF63_09855 [Opitutaceae bacterium]|nr:hypothetical protein [Opitutaceae bacterium]